MNRRVFEFALNFTLKPTPERTQLQQAAQTPPRPGAVAPGAAVPAATTTPAVAAPPAPTAPTAPASPPPAAPAAPKK
jgi:hypothetical protein